MPRRLSVLSLMFCAIFALATAPGCKPEIGDACQLSTNCSVTGDRFCDLSQPGGYCTVFPCEAQSCPGEAQCVELHPDLPRLMRRFCLRGCKEADDCRDGYVCVSPTERDGRIIDPSPDTTKVCMP